MPINSLKAPHTLSQGPQGPESDAQANKAVRNHSRSFSVGQGFTFLMGAVAAAQGLGSASARVLNQVPATSHNVTDLFNNIGAAGPVAAPGNGTAAQGASPAPVVALASPPPRVTVGTPPPPRVTVGTPPPPRVTVGTPPPPRVTVGTPPPPRVTTPVVTTPTAPASTSAGWAINPSLSFTRNWITSSLLAEVDITTAANPFAPPVQYNPNLPTEAPYSYETCHARTSTGATMCVQGINQQNLGLLVSAPHTLTCNDTAHAFWTVENTAWHKDLTSPLMFTNVVQFKNPYTDQCCLAYESNWNICDDVYPSHIECKDVENSCAMFTEGAQQAILHGHVPSATGETYDVPGTPGVCGTDTANRFACLDKTNLFNIPPGGRVVASNVGTGFVSTSTGCLVSAHTGELSGDCG